MPLQGFMQFFHAPPGQLFAALEARRAFDGPAEIVVSGTHYLEKPLVLDARDSGTTFRGENAVLSAGKRLELAWKARGAGIFEADYEGAAFSQLWANGARQHQARFPNFDAQNPLVWGDGWLQAAKRPSENLFEIGFNPADFPRRWNDVRGAKLHGLASHHWASLHYEIQSVDWGKGIFYCNPEVGGHQANEVMQEFSQLNERSRFWIENVREELDASGEWFFDAEAEKLYFWPPEGVDLGTAKIEIDGLQNIVQIRGTRENPVEDVEFRGFDFRHTAPTLFEPYEPVSMGDWSLVRQGAVFLEGTRDSTIWECAFRDLGGNAVFCNNWNGGVEIAENTFSQIGDSAVLLVGKSHLRTDITTTCEFCGKTLPYGWGEESNEIPEDCLISDNYMSHFGLYGKQTAGIFVALGRRNTIRHNQIHHCPRAAICLNDGLHGGHKIVGNDLFQTVLETGDHGPINAWGREEFWCLEQSHYGASHGVANVKKYARETTLIHGNRLRDAHGWGIDLDDGASNYLVTQNLCIGVSIKLREGDFRTVENNIFVNGANPPSIHVGYEGNNDVFRRNIVVTDAAFDNPENDVNFVPDKAGGAVFDFIWPPEQGRLMETDENLFWNSQGAFVTLRPRKGAAERLSLEEWQARGYDQNSRFGDPLFVDAENGDFRVRDGSPALELGFKNFPMVDFGPRDLDDFLSDKI